MAIKWTKAALSSVDEIAAYIAKDNPARASSFVLELQDAVAKLQTHPGMGRAGRVLGTRELVLHKNYIAIYRMRSDDVEILRLHHAARNL
jgi:toxin ParE1/3/4